MVRLCKGLATVCAALALIGASACDKPRPADRVITTGPDDKAMFEAESQAKTTLPYFWAEFEKDPARSIDPNLYSIKVAMPTPAGTEEIIWASDIKKDGDKITARLANDPDNLPGYKMGSSIDVNPAKIYDWSIARPNGWLGHYTTRVLIPMMSNEEGAQVRALLAPEPVPANAATPH